MRTFLLMAVLLLASAGCDRREDPDVDPASSGSSTPPGEMVDTTPESAATTAPTPPTPPPAIDPNCEGRAGAEGCPPVDDPRVPPAKPRPTRTPPQPR